MPKPLDKDDMYMIQKIEQNPYQDHLNEKEMRREKRELKKLRRKKNRRKFNTIDDSYHDDWN